MNRHRLDGRLLFVRRATLTFASLARACLPALERPPSDPEEEEDEERPRVWRGEASRPGSSMTGAKEERSKISSMIKPVPCRERFVMSAARSSYLARWYGVGGHWMLFRIHMSVRVVNVWRPVFGGPERELFVRAGAGPSPSLPAPPSESEEDAAAWCGLGWSVRMALANQGRAMSL